MNNQEIVNPVQRNAVVKRPPTLVELKRAEMMKHFDSHHHLAEKHKVVYMRPIIVDLPVMAKHETNANLSMIIRPEAVNLLAVSAARESILIMDATAASGVDVCNARVQYVVGASPVSNVRGMVHGEHYASVIHCVPTIEAALQHIREKLVEVTQQANLKKPQELPTELWSYMATREIRIIGEFKHLAEGIKAANMLMVHYPGSGSSAMFDRQAISARSLSFNNMGRILAKYNEKPHIEEMESEPTDVYEWFVWKNLKQVIDLDHVNAEVKFYFKDKHGNYKIDAMPKEETDLVVMSLEQWKQSDVGEAYCLLVTADKKAGRDYLDQSNVKVISIANTKDEALLYILGVLRAVQNQKDNEGLVKVFASFKKIHVFIDVIEDAY